MISIINLVGGGYYCRLYASICLDLYMSECPGTYSDILYLGDITLL